MAEAVAIAVGKIIDTENYSNDPTIQTTNLERLNITLTDYLNGAENLTIFNTLLRETGAVLAGGSILSVVINHPVRDYDVYVPNRNVSKFISGLMPLIYVTEEFRKEGNCRIIQASSYCESFLRKNGIRRIHTFGANTKQAGMQLDFPIDIMAVRNKRNVLDVVTNFDLTFCQVWYDGTSIYASHPDHIRDRLGYLQGDYIPLYIMGNRFLRDRVAKYTNPSYMSIDGYGISRLYIRAENAQFKVKINYLNDFIIDSGFNSKNRGICNFLNPTKGENQINLVKLKKLFSSIDNYREALDTLDPDDEDNKFQIADITDGLKREEERLAKLDADANKYFKQWYATQLLHFIFFNRKYTPFGYNTLSGNATRGHYYTVEENPDDERYNGVCSRKDDGYDSEDYEDDENLKVLVSEKYLTTNEKLPIDSKVSHVKYDYLYKLTEFIQSPYIPRYIIRRGQNAIDKYKEKVVKSVSRRLRKYVEWSKKNTMRTGLCPLEGDELPVWDLHEHSSDEAMCESAIQSHLEAHIGDTDKLRMDGKLDVVCYVKECTKRLSESEILTIISDNDFITRLRAPPDVSSKVNIGAHSLLLTNIKSADDGWGEIYHACICPFCLGQENRTAGCIYMQHQLDGKLSEPYCKPYNLINDIKANFIAAGNRLDDIENTAMRAEYAARGEQFPDFLLRKGELEFCAECCRPCWSHKHFTLDGMSFEPDFKTYPIGPDGQPEAEGQVQYNVCTGGGRVEAFARLLAIRKVLVNNPIADLLPGASEQQKKAHQARLLQQRKECALAANAAPLNAELMARAKEIADKTPETRTNMNLDTFVPVIAAAASVAANEEEKEQEVEEEQVQPQVEEEQEEEKENEEEEGNNNLDLEGGKLNHRKKYTRRNRRTRNQAVSTKSTYTRRSRNII
jgi:hypothetical protein